MGKKPPKKPEPEEIETEPGAEDRFERTVRRMLNTPPKPHRPIGRDRKSKAASKPRCRKERDVR